MYLFESLISFRVGPPRLVQNSKWFFFATDPLLELKLELLEQDPQDHSSGQNLEKSLTHIY